MGGFFGKSPAQKRYERTKSGIEIECDEERNICKAKGDFKGNFIKNGRILQNGKKMVMFDDCHNGECNTALVFEEPDKNVVHPGENESESIKFALDELEDGPILQTARLKDL